MRTAEVRILLVGVALWLLLVAELVLVESWDRSVAVALVEGATTEMFTGREAGIPVALQRGAPTWAVAQVSFTQDIAAVCVAYPLFLWLLHRYHDRDNWLMRRLRKVEVAAARHERFAHKWGPLGVFAFMLVPFLVNGPLLVALLGRLAGIRTRHLVLPVLAATAVAAVAWTYGYDALFRATDDMDPRIAPTLTVVFVGAIVVGGIWQEWRTRRAEARSQANEEE